ncbi:MAG: YqgE/AlgH family protein [Pseudomonadota bacterium]
MHININNFSKSEIIPPTGYLSGRLLIATPLVGTPAFSRSVILMYAHDEQGAMGIIINHVIENINYQDLFEQLAINSEKYTQKLPVHYGGPVEINRGFIIYNYNEFPHEETIMAVNNIAVSCSINVLREIAEGNGPKNKLLALGYAGWSAGQLEAEIEANSWISVTATPELIFESDNNKKWKMAAESDGIDISRVVTNVGHA